MPATYVLETNYNTVISTVKKGLLFLPSLCIAIAILVVSLIQTPDELSLPSFVGWDKVAHAVMYLALAVTLLHDLWKSGINNIKSIPITFLFCPFYGAMIEWLQAVFTQSRSADVWDWVADCIGTLVGIIIAYIIWRNRMKETTC